MKVMKFKLFVGFFLIVIANIAYGFDWNTFNFGFNVATNDEENQGKHPQPAAEPIAISTPELTTEPHETHGSG